MALHPAGGRSEGAAEATKLLSFKQARIPRSYAEQDPLRWICWPPS